MTQPSLWQRLKLWWNFQKIEQHYRDLGSPCPHMEAQRELYWRAKLEHLRDYATDEYLKTGQFLPDIKQDWMDEYIKPMADYTDYKELIAIRRVVKDMLQDELLHPDALALWNKRQFSRIEKDRTKFIDENPSGYTSHEMRVLLEK